MISRETENVKSSEEIESAFRALSSEGKPYVTKEELYQVGLWEGPKFLGTTEAKGCNNTLTHAHTRACTHTEACVCWQTVVAQHLLTYGRLSWLN